MLGVAANSLRAECKEEAALEVLIDAPEFDEDGDPIVMAWVTVTGGWSEPIDLDDLPGVLRGLKQNGDPYRVHWIADKTANSRYDRVRRTEAARCPTT